MAWGLAVSSSLAMAAAAVYVALGLRIIRRRVERDMAWANATFGCGWVALGAMVATDGLRLLTGFGEPSAPLYLALVELKIVATALAIFAFATYVLFIYTGRPAWAVVPPLIVAAAYIVFFLTITLARLPMTIEVGIWATRMHLQPGGSVPGGDSVGIALFFLPLVAITGMYLGLWNRAHDRLQHGRIVAVGASLIIFQLAASVQSNPSVPADSPLLPLALTLILAAGGFSYAAFWPPAWVRRRFSVEPPHAPAAVLG